jgi:hypothetical protein
METLRVEKIIQSNGTIVLENLPFDEGEKVEIIISKSGAESEKNCYPLRGTVYKYENPFESAVPPEDWEALK